MRSPQAAPLKPPNTWEWIAPNLAHASIATGSSGTMGMWNVTRSPVLTPAKSLSRAANSLTRTYRSWYVITRSRSSSSSETQMNAALFFALAR